MKGHTDNEVQFHLIGFGFVKDYTVWNYHGEKEVDATIGDASEGNLTSSTIEHVGWQFASSSTARATSDDNIHDYITMEDLLQDMSANDDGGGDGDEDAAMKDPKGGEIMEEIANRLYKDDILFGNSRWPENFIEIKQAASDPLYKGSSKHWMVPRFDL